MTTQVISKNKIVELTYQIQNTEGEIVEKIDLPVSYLHGSGKVFPQIEAALEGKKMDDEVNVVIPSEEAFGEPQEDLILTFDINEVPPEVRRIGAEAAFQNDKGEQKNFTVTNITEDTLTLDGNHPLAGQVITFIVKVVSVRDASNEEILAGEPEGGAMPFH